MSAAAQIASSDAPPINRISDTPWERIGAEISAKKTIPEILKAAHLDWNVTRLPTFTERPVAGTDPIRISIPRHFCLLREDTNAILSPYMGNRYKPIQNREAFETFSRFAEAGNMRLDIAGSLSGGKHIWALASINESLTLCPGELIEGYFLLVQSHAYGHSLRAMFTPVRFPGGHTLVRAINRSGKRGTYRMSHSREFGPKDTRAIAEVVATARESFAEYSMRAKYLANTPFDEAAGMTYLARVFQPELLKKVKAGTGIMPKTIIEATGSNDASRKLRKVVGMIHDYAGSDLPTCQNTAWGYYNAAVHAIDKGLGRADSTRLKSAWFGENSKLKNRALDIALASAAMLK